MPYKDRLRRLSALIRIGLSQSDERWSTDMAPAALRKAIDDIMQELASLGGQKPRADLIEVLRYKALKAEYEYSFGVIDGTAADELAHYLEFVRLPKALSAWSERKLRFLGRHDPRPLLRQKVWALMAMAFYYEYAHKGNVNGAIQMLEKLDEVVRNELAAMESAYAPNGTLARLYEFLAQCHRTARNYDTAQRYFMESERYGERRLRAKIEDHSVTPAQRLYEYQFSVISTARILGGVGRLATLQGALARAEVVLRCARTLLRPTGQVVMKNVAATYLAIVERRRCDPVEDRAAWQERLVRLKTLYFRFNPEDPDAPPPARVPDKTPPVERWIDQDGARRTAQELARAYLDEAEAQGRNVRGEALHNADTWLSKLDALADRRLNGGHESNERFRVHLLRASWYVLNHPPDFREALKLLKRAESIFKKHDEYSLDLVGFDSANLELTKLVVLGARFRAGEIDLATLSASFEQLAVAARDARDRVLESEVRLRWAMAYAHAGYDDEAQRQLNVWKGHAPFIGNAALHALHRAALGMIDRQHPPGFREGPEAPSPAAGVAADTVAIVDSEGWDAHEARLLEKLFERAMTRAGGNEAVARRILQLTPTRFDRLKAIHREAQEKKKSQE